MADDDPTKVHLGELLPSEKVDEDEVGNLVVFPDEPPKDGNWVDVHDVLANPTPEELEEGKALGEGIDPDDDEDGSEPDEGE